MRSLKLVFLTSIIIFYFGCLAANENGDMYLITIDPYDESAVICHYSEEISQDKLCEKNGGLPSGNYITWRGDLNKDGIEDIIIRNQSGRWGENIDIFLIFTGIRPGIFQKQGEIFTTSLTPSKEIRGGFLKLRSESYCKNLPEENPTLITSDVIYSKKLNRYKTKKNKGR